MGEVSRYPNGTFCWIDLGTPDVAEAKAFYGGLFDWDTEDRPSGRGGRYTVCRLEAKDVAAIHELGEGETPGWSSYISVDDVDAVTAKAQELGARELMEPFDVMDTGRMARIQDPAGAVVSLWQPRGLIGARLVNEVGAWSWNELVTADLDAAKAFYGDLFGWQAEDLPAAIPRASFTMENLLTGGVHSPTEQEVDAARWTVSFRVADADKSATVAQDLGGRILLPPMDIPIGRFAIVSDPSGAAFTITTFAGAWRGVDSS